MTDAPEEWTLCIDFGTAFSKAAAAPRSSWTAFDPEKVRPVALNQDEGSNPFLLESAVFVDDDHIVFAAEAVRRAAALKDSKRQALRSFKTLLSVSDLDRALNTAAPASIDPHRMFTMRDLVVFYLAHLLSVLDRGLEADPVLAHVEQLDQRYAAPAWRGADSAGLHGSVTRLFGEADALRELLAKDIKSGRGVPIKAAPGALAAVRAGTRVLRMGLIFEATAAAAYTSIAMQDAATHTIIADIGAGTTDITALERRGKTIAELPEARITLQQAGDFIDRLVANLALEAAPWARSQAHQAGLWAAVMRNVRDIKENVLLDGRALMRYEGRTLQINLRDLQKDTDFKAFMKDLTLAYDHALAVMRDAAVRAGARTAQSVAVGGGAAAPFVQDLIRRPPPRAKSLSVIARPATPEWAHARAFRGNLAPVFPQLAIAIGGALAPEEMLAASADEA